MQRRAQSSELCGFSRRKPQDHTLEETLNHAALSTNRGTIDHQALRTGDERNHRRNFLGCFKSFEQGARPRFLKEHFLHLSFGDILLFGQVVEENTGSAKAGGRSVLRTASGTSSRRFPTATYLDLKAPRRLGRISAGGRVSRLHLGMKPTAIYSPGHPRKEIARLPINPAARRTLVFRRGTRRPRSSRLISVR